MPDVLQPGNPVNEATTKEIRTRSKFDLSYQFFDTHRFGEYHPHFVFDGVADDKNITLNSAHDVRSYTLGAPLMQDISMKKDYFLVPLPAILPLNWEKWYKNPNVGDDVSDDVGCVVPQFWNVVGNAAAQLKNVIDVVIPADTTLTGVQRLNAVFRYWLFLECFYSNGNLLKSLGISGAPYFFRAYTDPNAPSKYISFDKAFDYAIADFIQSGIESFTVTFSNGSNYQVDVLSQNSSLVSSGIITLRSFLALARDDFNFDITAYSLATGATIGAVYDALRGATFTGQGFLRDSLPLNLSKVFAYQICCAHFYSNDHVDSIYSADLYRQLIMKSVFNIGASLTDFSFQYNGVTTQYDACSGHIFSYFIVRLNNAGAALAFLTNSVSTIYKAFRGYFCDVFSFRRSLRFVDYFTGSRSQPLAVGNANVAVDTGQGLVNVINLASGFQKTRFWNAVSRSGNKIKKYMREIMGTDVPYDYHEPTFLGHTSDSIFGNEVENTGVDQLTLANSVTSVLRSNASKYAFNFDGVDLPCVILGLTYYDIPRIYTRAIERTNFHANRFDIFNPFMQFVGDQNVWSDELGYPTGLTPTNFGYQLRHMEYKQRYSQGSGGFVENLPGYMFKADDSRFADYPTAPVIDEEFIRSIPSELDDFYVSLTGYSLGSYFHFIVKNVNSCTASRPMAYAPSIL